MTNAKKTPHGTTVITEDGTDQVQAAAGGGKDEGSPRATDQTAQPVTNAQPGDTNSPGGALNAGPDASRSGGMTGNNG